MNNTTAFHVGNSGFGTPLDAPPTVDEALNQTGLNWDVALQQNFTKINGEFVETPSRSVVRQDTQQVLGTVNRRYTALQNRDAFNVFAPYLESGELTLESGGSLSGGKKIWCLARIKGDPAEVVKGDPVFNYVLLSNSHDGSLALRFGFTCVRVVCCNMLHSGGAHSETASKLVSIRHTKNASDALVKVAETMNLAKRDFEASVQQYKAMAAKGVRTTDLEAYVQRVFKPEIVKGGKWEDVRTAHHAPAVKNLVEKIEPLMEDETNTLPGVKGTVWSMYNAVTHYLTHEHGRSEDQRVNSLFFGNNAAVNRRAVTEALELAVA